MNKLSVVGILGLVLCEAGCGVKGPPLPPVSDTPQASDRVNAPPPAPAPSTLVPSRPTTR